MLATINPDGRPHLTEMWYGIRDDDLFFNTTEERRKRLNLARDPRVSLLVSAEKGDVVWRTLVYVRVDGRARIVSTGEQALDDIVALAVRYDGPQAGASARMTYATMHRVTYAVDIARVYLKGL